MGGKRKVSKKNKKKDKTIRKLLTQKLQANFSRIQKEEFYEFVKNSSLQSLTTVVELTDRMLGVSQSSGSSQGSSQSTSQSSQGEDALSPQEIHSFAEMLLHAVCVDFKFDSSKVYSVGIFTDVVFLHQ
jgi:hypothetical protein